MFDSIFRGIVSFVKGSMRLIKGIVIFIVSVTVIGLACFIGAYLYFAKDLPDIKTIEDYRPAVISEAFSSDGTKIGEFWTECRIFVPFDKIPKHIVQAFVDAEDSRFFEHKGVDFRSIIRAFFANLKAGEITQGGSTITQQITRSLLLSRERTITRKIKEAILAIRLERYLDKEQILTMYLNQIYLGNRAYGVAAAARNYFDTKLEDLTIGQAALLAGMPSAPSTFSPINSPEEARKKQLHVLNRMVEEDDITEEQAAKAAKETFRILTAGIDKEFVDKDAAYFTEHVRRLVKEKYGDQILYNEGLKIYTTLDLDMQRKASEAVRKNIESIDRRQGYRGPIGHVAEDEIDARASLIGKAILDEQRKDDIQWPPGKPRSGDERSSLKADTNYEAVVTGFVGDATTIRIGGESGTIPQQNIKWAKPFSNKWLGAADYDYVKDPHQILKVGDVILVKKLPDGQFALSQEPSIQSSLVAIAPSDGFIKAMVGGYEFRFDKDEFNRATQAVRQPGSSFKPFVYAAALDKGYTYNTVIVDEPVVYQVGINNFWSPKNYGGKYNGPTPFRKALMFSRNVPTVKITYDIGTHYLAAYVRKLGITTPLEKYLSMALGANAVTLTELTQAYTVFVNNGRLIPAVAITKVVDSRGKVLESIQSGEADSRLETRRKNPLIGDAAAKGVRYEEWMSKHNIPKEELNVELLTDSLDALENDKLILTDLEIQTLYGSHIPPGHVMTPQTAYLMVDLLKGVVEGGTGTRVKALGKPVGGKTGTTNDETDVWFIGFVPDLVTGVWVGFDELKQIGKGVAGGNTAAPIFLDFMKDATEKWEAKEFAKPEDFPSTEISMLAGGSSLFGSRPNQAPMDVRGGSDRAGQFFEEDMESFDNSSYPSYPSESPPPAGQDEDEAVF